MSHHQRREHRHTQKKRRFFGENKKKAHKQNMRAEDAALTTPPRQHRPPHSPRPHLPSPSASEERNQWLRRQRERGDHLPPPLFFPTSRRKNTKRRERKLLICGMFAFVFGVYFYVMVNKLSDLFLYMNWTRSVVDDANQNKANSARRMMLLLKI